MRTIMTLESLIWVVITILGGVVLAWIMSWDIGRRATE